MQRKYSEPIEGLLAGGAIDLLWRLRRIFGTNHAFTAVEIANLEIGIVPATQQAVDVYARTFDYCVSCGLLIAEADGYRFPWLEG